jgi:hypothetical protein
LVAGSRGFPAGDEHDAAGVMAMLAVLERQHDRAGVLAAAR